MASFALALLAIQRLEGPALIVGLAVSLGLALLLAPKRLWTLIRRSRFLFFALIVLDAFFTVGDRLWILSWLPSPTREGLWLTLTQTARLAGLLCMVALLLEKMPTERLIAGLYALMRPLAVIGFNRTHAAVRLTLVLDWLERRPVLRWRDWLVEVDTVPTEPIRFEMPYWHALDSLCVALVLASAGALWLQ